MSWGDRAMHLTQPDTTYRASLAPSRVVCTAEKPWKPGMGRTIHPEDQEVGDQRSEWPLADVVTYKCPHCGLLFEAELPQ